MIYYDRHSVGCQLPPEYDPPTTDCSCPLSGYCTRHQVIKTPHWNHLCKTSNPFFQKWEAGTGPGQRGDRDVTKARHLRILAGSEHWRLLHTLHIDFKNLRYNYRKWVTSIPSYGCSCKESWSRLTTKYPPPFNDPYLFFFWGVDRHNDINNDLKRPIFPYLTAVRLYNLSTPIPEHLRNSILALQQNYTRPKEYVHSLFELSSSSTSEQTHSLASTSP